MMNFMKRPRPRPAAAAADGPAKFQFSILRAAISETDVSELCSVVLFYFCTRRENVFIVESGKRSGAHEIIILNPW